MSGILVVAEARRGELQGISLELIEIAKGVAGDSGGPLTVGLVSTDAEALAAELNVEGVDEIVTVNPPLEHFEAYVAERALGALIESVDPGLVLLGHTIDTLNYAPALAATEGFGFVSDALSVSWDNGPVVQRGTYGDHLLKRLEFPDRSRVLALMRAGSSGPASGSGSASVRSLDVDFDEALIVTEHLDYREAETGDVDLTKEDFLLSIGRGVGDEDNIAQFEELAAKIGATLSVSRPIVDAGWVSSARQVGQSGTIVEPKVYLALGISGAVQHLVGMKNSETIVAVNTDPEAPIFNVATYGVVGDMFEFADALGEHF